jgi:hypothetical protein
MLYVRRLHQDTRDKALTILSSTPSHIPCIVRRSSSSQLYEDITTFLRNPCIGFSQNESLAPELDLEKADTCYIQIIPKHPHRVKDSSD